MTAQPIGTRKPGPTTEPAADGYSEFYSRYHRPLVSYLRMHFPDADVEAVAQEVFCRALSHWSEIAVRENLWPWLAVTARHLAYNNIRDERSSRAVGLDVLDPAAPHTNDVARQVEATDELRLLAKAMDVLTPLQHLLLTVLIEEGLTGAQLARRLNMKPGTVRMHLCRLRARLADRLEMLGGQLALLPFVAGLGARLRRHANAAPQAVFTAASTALAATAALFVMGVPFAGISPGSAASSPVSAARSPAITLAVLESSQARPAARTASPGLTAPIVVSGSAPQHLPVPGASYHLTVSQTPTKPGTPADAGVRVETPAGDLYAEVPVTLEAGDPGALCAGGIGC